MDSKSQKIGQVQNPDIPRLPFSEKYDTTKAEAYFKRHHTGSSRRLSNWRETAMLRKALKMAGNPKIILDLPSGTGRFWKMLTEEENREIYAADNSHEMLGTGLSMQPPEITKRLKPLLCSTFAIPLREGAVENVFSIRLIHHVGKSADRVAMLKEMARVASSTVCISLWVDGNYKAHRRRKLEATRERKGYQNRFIIPRKMINEEFSAAGLEPIGRIDFIKLYSMWSTYVLRKIP